MLSCIHCRASAITDPLPGELTKEEGLQLIDHVAAFGKPYPTIIFTGGDPLKRRDLFELLEYAANAGAGFAVSPAVTELLTPSALKRIKLAGASSISISLDGACAETHDAIRGLSGTFDKTIEAIRTAVNLGLGLQVNTAIMKQNFNELPQIFHLIKMLKVRVWELFFLVKIGRGIKVDDLTPRENESVNNFLYDASCYGLTVRCVEAPFIRRIAKQRIVRGDYWDDELYRKFRSTLLEFDGEPTSPSTLRLRGTLDGDGVIFVAHDGTIFPGGLLPYSIGNIRKDSLVEAYRENILLRKVRTREMDGYCGVCEFKDVCGGSRARAYAYYGNPLSSDPACILATP